MDFSAESDYSTILSMRWAQGMWKLDTETCDRKVGCIRLQQQPTKKAIGYWFRLLNHTECSCDTTHKECKAIVPYVLLLRPYLKGARFTNRLITMHFAGHWTPKMRLVNSSVNASACPNVGIKHQVADAHLQLPTDGHDETKLKDALLLVKTIPACKQETGDARSEFSIYYMRCFTLLRQDFQLYLKLGLCQLCWPNLRQMIFSWKSPRTCFLAHCPQLWKHWIWTIRTI